MVVVVRTVGDFFAMIAVFVVVLALLWAGPAAAGCEDIRTAYHHNTLAEVREAAEIEPQAMLEMGLRLCLGVRGAEKDGLTARAWCNLAEVTSHLAGQHEIGDSAYDRMIDCMNSARSFDMKDDPFIKSWTDAALARWQARRAERTSDLDTIEAILQ